MRPAVTVLLLLAASPALGGQCLTFGSENPCGKLDHIQVPGALSDAWCLRVIAAADALAARTGGWKDSGLKEDGDKTKLQFGSTTDVPAVGMTEVWPYLSTVALPRLYKPLGRKVDIYESYVVRYSGQAHSELVGHVDFSVMSFVIPLSDPSEFEGGGTFFPDTGELLKPPRGTGVLFRGMREHVGVAVTNGSRYVLAGFTRWADVSPPPPKRAARQHGVVVSNDF